MDQRRSQLLHALRNVGVEPRQDSYLCKAWVETGAGNLESVVQAMCEAKYLHEYCNFRLGYNLARGALKYHGSKLPQPQWLQLVRNCVLKTTSTEAFPLSWPWQVGISPAQWKEVWDRTPTFFSTFQ